MVLNFKALPLKCLATNKVIEEDIYNDGDEDEERDRDYHSEDWPSYTGWMELEGVEEDDLGSAQPAQQTPQ